MSILNRRDGEVVRAIASQLVDLGSILKSSHTSRLSKIVFASSLLDAQHEKDSAEKNPAS